MLEEITNMVGKEAFTDRGVRLGFVENARLDIGSSTLEGLYFGESNPDLVEGGNSLTIPFRWVQSVGEVIILKYFPEKVDLPADMVPPEPFEPMEYEEEV